jgi:hypothetical protein
MNKPKRTPTLDSFIIKKSKNISTTSCDPDSDQHGEVVNVVSNSSITNVKQHVIANNANEPTPIVSSQNNQLSIQNNCCSLTEPIASNEHCFFFIVFYLF